MWQRLVLFTGALSAFEPAAASPAEPLTLEACRASAPADHPLVAAARAQAQWKRAQARVEVGQRPRFDLIRAEVEANRPELRAVRARVKAPESARDAARSQYWPSVGANGAWGVRGPAPRELETGWQATAQLTVPLFAGGADQARYREAEANAALVTAQAEQLVRSPRLELDAGRLAAVAAQCRLEAAQRLRHAALDLDLAAIRLARSLGRAAPDDAGRPE